MAESSNKSQRNVSPNRLDKTEFAWQSQDDFMKTLEAEPLDNPLVYEKIPYYSREWDNIPPIVPRYVIQLSKYMDGVTKQVKYQSELETVASLREFTERADSAINDDIATVKESAQVQEMTLRTEVQAVEKFANDLSQRQNEFSNSLYYNKTVNQHAKTDEEAVVKEYERYILEQIKPKLTEQSAYAKMQHEQDMQ